MAKEGDRKTTKGLLKSRDKVEDILATLANIDPETDDVTIEVRRARGIGEALKRVLFRIDEVIQHVMQGRTIPQMTLDEVLQRAYTAVPQLRDDEREAIKAAALRGPTERQDDGDEPQEEEDETPEKPGSAAVENLNAFFAPPAILAEKLAAAGRPLPVSFLETWSAEDRAAALAWVDKPGHAGLPMPECLGQIFLEDLDLGTVLHRVQLMIWIGLESPSTLESVRQNLDVPEYAMADWEWEAIAPWVVAAHRRDRGERGIEMPEPPPWAIPAPEVLTLIKLSLAEEGEASFTDLFGERGLKEDLSAHLAVHTLLQAGEIVTGDDGKLHAARPDLVEAEDKLLERAHLIATRGGSTKPVAEAVDWSFTKNSAKADATEGPDTPAYELAYITDPRQEDAKDPVRAVIRFSGQEKTASNITGVSIRTPDQGPTMVRNNAELSYLEDADVLWRTRESWEEIQQARIAGMDSPEVSWP